MRSLLRTGWIILALVSSLFVQRNIISSEGKCVQIYYDQMPNENPKYVLGRIHAQLLQNLLGHFPHIQQYIAPIESYQKGEIEKCQASIYLGTHYNSKIPESFFKDYVSTQKNVLWAGYQVWKLSPEVLDKLWGVEFLGLSKLDQENKDPQGRPGFFKFYEYHGERFFKYGEFDLLDKNKFMASFEISLFSVKASRSPSRVLSWATHSTQTNNRTPYVLRNENHWYFGDSPFYFTTEDDRYLILADCLFDLLEEKPIRSDEQRPAIFRLEDIHAKLQMWQLYKMTDLLHSHKVPFSMTVIPVFSDPLGISQEKVADRFVPLTKKKEFLEFLKYAESKGASFIFHGVTHQYAKSPNPFTGMSGDDFEFWDRVHNKPVDRDSSNWVLDRLREGRELLQQAQVTPVAWISPHYQASPLDYSIFSEVFDWNMGRMIYFPFIRKGQPSLPDRLKLNSFQGDDDQSHLERKRFFNHLRIDYTNHVLPSGQFFPFEIYGDSLGQRIIPENVGNVQPYLNEQVMRTLSVDQMVQTMKRNRKLRDTWASYFIHPFLLEQTSSEGLAKFAGDVEEIEKLINQTRQAGYEFIDLKAWVEKAPKLRTLPAIERF